MNIQDTIHYLTQEIELEKKQNDEVGILITVEEAEFFLAALKRLIPNHGNPTPPITTN